MAGSGPVTEQASRIYRPDRSDLSDFVASVISQALRLDTWRGVAEGEIPSKGATMKVNPFHTDSPEYPPEHREVHHDNDACPDGKRIKPWHRELGTGGHPLCKECKKL